LYSSEKETEAKGDGDSAPSEDQAPNQIKSTDILNSPAFLRRKLDVIKSDIAKVEEDIQAATVQAQEGQAEWGQQLEDLEVEVRKRGLQQVKSTALASSRAYISPNRHGLIFFRLSVSKHSEPIQSAGAERR
jgi:hypothetical protein